MIYIDFFNLPLDFKPNGESESGLLGLIYTCFVVNRDQPIRVDYRRKGEPYDRVIVKISLSFPHPINPDQGELKVIFTKE